MGLLLAAALGGAGPVTRSYEVREDPETGRLIRVARRLKGSLGSSTARPGAAAQGKKVVQGSSAGLVGKFQAGRVDVASLVRLFGGRYEVDPRLIHAVIRQESGYDPFAVSPKGAQGLMQLMPATAERLGVKDVFDPAENVRGGVKLLRELIDRYDGDVRLALAAYNAGEGAVERYGGVPPYRETVDYVNRVERRSRSFSESASGGFSRRRGRARLVARLTASGGILFETAHE